MHFTSEGPLLSHRRMSEIDTALVDYGTKRNAEKDVTGATNGTALGIDLVDGLYFALATNQLGILLSGVTFILKQRLLSPLEMHTLLRSLHMVFSIWPGHHFHVSMTSTTLRANQMSERKKLFHLSCVSGLFAAVSILLQIRIELRRPSQGRGFGASVAAIRPCRARQLSRLSDRRRDLVRFQRDKDVFNEPGTHSPRSCAPRRNPEVFLQNCHLSTGPL